MSFNWTLNILYFLSVSVDNGDLFFKKKGERIQIHVRNTHPHTKEHDFCSRQSQKYVTKLFYTLIDFRLSFSLFHFLLVWVCIYVQNVELELLAKTDAHTLSMSLYFSVFTWLNDQSCRVIACYCTRIYTLNWAPQKLIVPERLNWKHFISDWVEIATSTTLTHNETPYWKWWKKS